MGTENRHPDAGNEGRRRWGEWRERHGNVPTTICEIVSRGHLLCDSGNTNQGSERPPRGERRVGGGSGA